MPPAGSKKRRGDSDDGWPQIARMVFHRCRPFPRGAFQNGWKAIEHPPQDTKYSWDEEPHEDMHNDARYRDHVNNDIMSDLTLSEPDRPNFGYDSAASSLDL